LAWSVEFTATAEKQLLKLDRLWQALVVDYLENEVASLANPRLKGKALVGNMNVTFPWCLTRRTCVMKGHSTHQDLLPNFSRHLILSCNPKR
jgi:hypothetical protein